jgi:hypothetical protein
MFLSFVMFTFWNSYVLKLLRLDTITLSDATLSDISVVLCYVLSQYHNNYMLFLQRPGYVFDKTQAVIANSAQLLIQSGKIPLPRSLCIMRHTQ